MALCNLVDKTDVSETPADSLLRGRIWSII